MANLLRQIWIPKVGLIISCPLNLATCQPLLPNDGHYCHMQHDSGGHRCLEDIRLVEDSIWRYSTAIPEIIVCCAHFFRIK